MAVIIYTGDVIRAQEEPVFLVRLEIGGENVFIRSVAVTVHRRPTEGASDDMRAAFDELAAQFERGKPVDARQIEEKAFSEGDSMVQLGH